jgi:DNA/RNA-binding protein KIN17
MLDTNDKIRVDQAHVETVIPAIGKVKYISMNYKNIFFLSLGKKVLIVNGAYRGQEATLEDIHQDSFSVDVTLLTVRFRF